MLTPDDGGTDGKTHPSLFPAKKEVLNFCQTLRESKDLQSVSTLPTCTASHYSVTLHKPMIYFQKQNRAAYFDSLFLHQPQLLFLDPDNGFEPEKSCNEKHVQYIEISTLLNHLPDSSAISVFHHFRRRHFPDDFRHIKERLDREHCTAIYWHSLMFVLISKSRTTIEGIRAANAAYAAVRPVRLIN